MHKLIHIEKKNSNTSESKNLLGNAIIQPSQHSFMSLEKCLFFFFPSSIGTHYLEYSKAGSKLISHNWTSEISDSVLLLNYLYQGKHGYL